MTAPSLPSRRALLALPLAAAACAPPTPPPPPAPPAPAPAPRRVPPRVQEGLAAPQPARTLLLAYDLAPRRRDLTAVRDTLTALHAAPVPGVTRTLAAGPHLHRALGLPAPRGLAPLPPLPGDRLDASRGDGDLLVQLCGAEPEALERAAVRFTALARAAFAPRWRQAGFLPPGPPGQTPRNLFGFKDGTENPSGDELARWVWHADGSTFLVYRRIHMAVGGFAALPAGEQEDVIGRRRDSGAPLGGRAERDPVNLYAKTPQGRYVIPADAHVRLAHSRLDGGARMLRRGYSYDDGPGDSGLLFLAYMRDPALFARVQQRLAAQDAMSRFVEHRASAVALVLPAPAPGGTFGDGLR
ncbi:Dyp-type peroxidase [Streptomyces sp. NPDC001941]|uniref:Dyp-type peroxidase n=1 Tax=Streptomyces sp. NPDC001941 TaxID=3154659 RepID=UPI00331E21A5